MLRFRRNVRTVSKIHSVTRRKQKQHFSLRTGSQRRHLENGQNEHGNPRNRCKLWRSSRRYLFQRSSFHTEVRLHHGKSALQLTQLGSRQIAERPSLGIRTSTHRQRKLRLDRTHDLSPVSKRKIGLVLANDALSTQTSGEGEIRRKIIEADLIEGIVAMPTQLFYSVTIPVPLWFITRGKKQTGKTLFIDARNMGHMVDRKHRDFSEEDIAHLANTFTDFQKGTLEDVKGFCAVATTKQIASQDYILTPGRYVGIEEKEEDVEPIADKMNRLTTELGGMFAKSHELEEQIKKNLEGIGWKI